MSQSQELEGASKAECQEGRDGGKLSWLQPWLVRAWQGHVGAGEPEVLASWPGVRLECWLPRLEQGKGVRSSL